MDLIKNISNGVNFTIIFAKRWFGCKRNKVTTIVLLMMLIL